MTSENHPVKCGAKNDLTDLALFGGSALFDKFLSTSNLVKPSFDVFLDYSKIFYTQGQYTNRGPLSQMLEARLAKLHDVKHCLVFSGGFWAVVLSLKCLALTGRKNVILPSYTYRKLADIVSWAGLSPVFCEVDASTLAMSAETVAPLIDDNTAAILAVHPIVNQCPVDDLETLAQSRKIPLVFDSVESTYETVNGRPIGSFGDAECFSMHASKLINGFEGGYVTTNNTELANQLYAMRAFGFVGQDEVVTFGMNAKLNEVHAAMALACLDDLDSQIVRNQERYQTYCTEFSTVPGVRLLEFDEAERCGYKCVVIELLESWPLSSEVTLKLLHAEKVIARAQYTPPLHHVSASSEVRNAEMVVTNSLAGKYLLLPSGHTVECADIFQIAELLKYIASNSKGIIAEINGRSL